jgi:hypothetical protein
VALVSGLRSIREPNELDRVSVRLFVFFWVFAAIFLDGNEMPDRCLVQRDPRTGLRVVVHRKNIGFVVRQVVDVPDSRERHFRIDPVALVLVPGLNDALLFHEVAGRVGPDDLGHADDADLQPRFAVVGAAVDVIKELVVATYGDWIVGSLADALHRVQPASGERIAWHPGPECCFGHF